MGEWLGNSTYLNQTHTILSVNRTPTKPIKFSAQPKPNQLYICTITELNLVRTHGLKPFAEVR
jgi:hypothetical protein